ncbi:MAG: hypothetical protein IJ172_02440 [Ruminococcus sp.]|nr:hypothetical protein [Ruminococcus sp.]
MSELITRQFQWQTNKARFLTIQSFAGESADVICRRAFTSTSKARRVCERNCEREIAVKI